VLVALLVPLVLNLSRRVDAEVKAEASGQVQLIAATAASASSRLAVILSTMSPKENYVSGG